MVEARVIDAERREAGGALDAKVADLLKRIPKLPPFASSLAAKLLDDKVSVGDIAQMIKSDPSLTGLVLKVVNSPYYSLRMAVTNINQAVMLLGVKQVHRMVMDNCLNQFFPSSVPEFERLQKHSYLVSVMAEETADVVGRLHLAGLVNTVGLLHDIGKSVILLLKRKNPQFAGELDRLDQEILGVELLTTWGLPAEICTAIRHHAGLKRLSADDLSINIPDDVAILQMAHACAAQIFDDGEMFPDDAFTDRCLASVGSGIGSAKILLAMKLLPRLQSRSRQLPQNIQEVLKPHLKRGW